MSSLLFRFLPQLFQLTEEPVGEGSLQMDRSSGPGMGKDQLPGVETLSGKAGHRLLASVDLIAQQRMAQMGHMDPNLMGPAGLQTAADMGIALIAANDLPMGDRPAALRVDGHPLPVGPVTGNGGVHRAGILPEPAHGDGLVGPGQRMVLKLLRQGEMGHVVFGGDDQTAGVPVDPMDDTRRS